MHVVYEQTNMSEKKNNQVAWNFSTIGFGITYNLCATIQCVSFTLYNYKRLNEISKTRNQIVFFTT